MSKGNKPTRDDKKTMKKKVIKPESLNSNLSGILKAM